MDDETGWNDVLVDGWGPLVREAVCERVEASFAASRGLLALTVSAPDDAPAAATERVHEAVVAAIARETGADLDLLGSQAAWATYDDVWAELGRRATDDDRYEAVPPAAVQQVVSLLQQLPPAAVELAGALHDDGGRVVLLRRDEESLLDVDGLFRWLATDDRAEGPARTRARAVVALARG